MGDLLCIFGEASLFGDDGMGRGASFMPAMQNGRSMQSHRGAPVPVPNRIVKGRKPTENKLSKYLWGSIALLLGAAYGLPALGFVLPAPVLMILYPHQEPCIIFIFCRVEKLRVRKTADYRKEQ